MLRFIHFQDVLGTIRHDQHGIKTPALARRHSYRQVETRNTMINLAHERPLAAALDAPRTHEPFWRPVFDPSAGHLLN